MGEILEFRAETPPDERSHTNVIQITLSQGINVERTWQREMRRWCDVAPPGPTLSTSVETQPYLIDYERLNLGLEVIESIRLALPNEPSKRCPGRIRRSGAWRTGW